MRSATTTTTTTHPQPSNHLIEDNIDGAPAAAAAYIYPPSSLAANVSGEVCPNRPFADARNDVIRYPMCLRQPGWNAAVAAAASAAAAQSAVVVGESGGVGVSTASTATATGTGTVMGWEGEVGGAQASASSPAGTGSSGEPKQQQQSQNMSEEEQEDDIESPLDNSNFLSFEEWREQNLAKIGQSADSVARNARKDSRPRRQPSIRNNLESIGDEGEIDLDFGGFASEIASSSTWNRPQQTPAKEESSANGGGDGGDGDDISHTPNTDRQTDMEDPVQPNLTKRKNAGVTCKERSNYASFDCAATVLKTNRECSGASAVLVENKDSYMLNECRAQNKFIILELCDDILIDTIVLANFEFFSSRFRTFRVSVSDRYPPKPDKWKELGVFEALNTREIQAFPVENPLIWTRYVKIEFLTHYGNEFYCPLSLIRVHGTTMMEEFKSEGENSRSDEASEDQDGIMSELEPEGITVMERIAGNNTASSVDQNPPSEQPIVLEEIEIVLPESAEDFQFPTFEEDGDFCDLRGSEIERLLLHEFEDDDITPICGVEEFPTPTLAESGSDMAQSAIAGTESSGSIATPGSSTSDSLPSSTSAPSTGATSTQAKEKTPSKSTSIASIKSTTLDADDAISVIEAVKTAKSTNQPPPQQQQQPSTSSSAPASPSPTTQESFFKSMNKRLQMLETNSTLSLLYIGEQSRILREAFSKVEKRQLGKTTAFLENLNHTVLTELHDFRQQYDQVWQSVIMEFEQQRVQYNREVFAVTRQLGVLADEVLFQKRLSLIQSIFLLILFGIMIFSRGPVRRYLELPPRVQGMLGRGGSPILRGSWQRYPFSFPLRSPSQSPLSVPGSPVSDGMVHEQPAEEAELQHPEQQPAEHPEIRHRKSSTVDYENGQIMLSAADNEMYPVSDHSSPGSVASSSSSASHSPSSPASVPFDDDVDDEGVLDENRKDEACMPDEHIIDTTDDFAESHPADLGHGATDRRPLSEITGNDRRPSMYVEDDTELSGTKHFGENDAPILSDS